MTAAVKNLVIEQKATFKKRFTWRDKFKKPINLTGFGARMSITDEQGNVIVTLTVENGRIILGGAAGTIDLLLAVTETTALQVMPLFYDLKIINPDLTEDRKLQGKVVVSVGRTA